MEVDDFLTFRYLGYSPKYKCLYPKEETRSSFIWSLRHVVISSSSVSRSKKVSSLILFRQLHRFFYVFK